MLVESVTLVRILQGPCRERAKFTTHLVPTYMFPFFFEEIRVLRKTNSANVSFIKCDRRNYTSCKKIIH